MIESTGVPTVEQIQKGFPDRARIQKGPVAIIECYQEIPCNPCATACHFDAIEIGHNINHIPQLKANLCSGCGLCLAHCPGLAIMIVDGSKDETMLHFTIPYECLPVPEKGEWVDALDRTGQCLGKAKVVKVKKTQHNPKTLLVTLQVPEEWLFTFRNILVGGQYES